MRLEAAVGTALLTTGAVCSGFGHDLVHALNRRHVELHLLKRQSAATPMNSLPTSSSSTSSAPSSKTVSTADVFNAPVWPTVSVPAGFTLAGGVQITPLPAMALSSVTGSAALSAAIATATPAADPATWNNEAGQKCAEAVAKLNGKASNPSGMAACYNIPYLDDQKGMFEAEVRIFNVSMPTGDFVGVSQGNMMLNLEYQNASLTSSSSFPVRRMVKRQSGVWMATQIMVQKYLAQVNPDAFTPGMNITLLKPALSPLITISAISPQTGGPVNATLPLTDASFVAGVYSQVAGSLTDPAFLLGKPLQDLAAAAQGLPTPFVVPGIALGVMPIGLSITLLWTLIFLMAVGYGTVCRIQFREQFRQDVRRQRSGSIKRL